MDATSHHILTAESHINRLQQDQLRWAETSPEAAAALHAARTRAVLKTAARMNATVDQLHQLRIVMSEAWSVQVERRGDLAEAAQSWAEANCGGDDEEWEVLSIAWLVEELWPDVVAETDTWARRHARRCGCNRNVPVRPAQPFGGYGSFLPTVSVLRIWLLSLR